MTWITANFPFLAPELQQRVVGFTTTRNGGVSNGKYHSFNLAMHVGDEPSAVQANRALLREGNGHYTLPSEPYWLEQTHSDKVLMVPEQYKQGLSDNADASCTRHSDTVCAVMTADCLPLLITDASLSFVAAVHAGWRGLANGIIGNTLAAVKALPHNCHVWLGPAIGPREFEVGEDVRSTFVDLNARYNEAFIALGGSKYLADIYQLARIQLNLLGVEHISGGEHCTVTEQDQFFSYRRDGQTGRMVSCIWLKS